MSNFELIIYHGAGSVTYTEGNSSRVEDRQLEWHESHSRKLTFVLENGDRAAANNFLSSSCAVWSSGTGAIALGDKVKYSIYPTSTAVKTEVFYGKITNLNQASDGRLNVEAMDYLYNLEVSKFDKIIYSNYRDRLIRNHSEANGKKTITGVTDASIAIPFVAVEYAADDAQLALGSSTPAAAEDIRNSYDVAQSFIAPGDGIVGVQFAYNNDASNPGNMTVSIQGTNSSGEPDGVDLVSNTFAMETPSDASWDGYTLLTSSGPTALVKGRKYWVVFHTTTNAGATSTTIRTRTPSSYVITSHLWKSDGINWAEQADEHLNITIDYITYQIIPTEEYAFDDATDVITINGNIGVQNPLQTYSSFYRGRLSYYYGTVDIEDIFETVVNIDSELLGEATTLFVRPFSVYQTRGKYLGECVRELADVFETSGTYSGYQHCATHYRDGTTQYIKLGKRLKTTDTPAFTFSHGADTATDDEVRIIDIDLTKTIKARPASVVVVGQSPSGAPVVASRDDRALSASLRTKTGLALTEAVYDPNVHTVSEADKVAWAYLDAVSRDVWEGSITISGVYPDLMHLVTSYITYGSGEIITLNYSPLGISALNLKVTGYICYPNKTTAFVTNNEALDNNKFTKSATKTDKNESFLSPTEPTSNAFFSCFKDAAVTTATLYMQLCKSNGTAIDGSSRVLCTKMSNSTYNMNTYHAEFEMDNGYTIDGTSLVTRIELYTAATGGSEISEYVLTASEQFPKWKSMRVIVDFNAKIS